MGPPESLVASAAVEEDGVTAVQDVIPGGSELL